MRMATGILLGFAAVSMVGLALCSGCESDDEDDGVGAAVLVTNVVVVGGQTNAVVVTNAAAAAAQGAVVLPVSPNLPSLQIAAPLLVSPRNGARYIVTAAAPEASITYEWTPVPGAAGYVINIEDLSYAVMSGSTVFQSRSWRTGTYTWSVQTLDASFNRGPSSVSWTFEVVRLNLPQ